jgi:thiol-disulfide isomerase/thioredoxin
MITVKRFTAPWCQPCKVLAPQFKKFEAEFTDLQFDTIDVDANPEPAELYGIRNVPTVIVEKDNQIITRLVGLNHTQKYIDAFNSARETT